MQPETSDSTEVGRSERVRGLCAPGIPAGPAALGAGAEGTVQAAVQNRYLLLFSNCFDFGIAESWIMYPSVTYCKARNSDLLFPFS